MRDSEHRETQAKKEGGYLVIRLKQGQSFFIEVMGERVEFLLSEVGDKGFQRIALALKASPSVKFIRDNAKQEKRRP